MLVKDIGSCKDCPIYMKICHGNKDVLISHCIEPPCVYLNADDDIEKEVGQMMIWRRKSGQLLENSSLSQRKLRRQQPLTTKHKTN